jgi:hypothetical protein
MVVVHELSDHDTVAEGLIRILSDDVIVLKTDEEHLHLSGCVH